LYLETGTKAQIDSLSKQTYQKKKKYTWLERGDQTGQYGTLFVVMGTV
jgi:hypothetical protein